MTRLASLAQPASVCARLHRLLAPNSSLLQTRNTRARANSAPQPSHSHRLVHLPRRRVLLAMTHIFSSFKLPSRDALALTEGSVCKRASGLGFHGLRQNERKISQEAPEYFVTESNSCEQFTSHESIMRCTIDRISNMVCTNPLPQRSE